MLKDLLNNSAQGKFPYNQELDIRYKLWLTQRAVGCTSAEYQILLALVKELKPSRILEVGPGCGASTVSMLLGDPQCTIQQVTYDAGSGREVLAENEIPRIQTFYGTSDAFFIENKEVFDFAFIDGDHTDSGSHRDLRNALRFLKPNCVLAAHDIFCVGSEHIGRHCNTLANEFGKSAILIHTEHQYSGIGVIY